MKLMDIDSDTLGIPDTDYDVCVTMPVTESFATFCSLASLFASRC